MTGVATAQIDTFIDAAQKLAQGGIVLVLMFLLIVAIWGCKVLFEAYKENSLSTISAMSTQTEALKAMTRAMEANERASDANRASIELLKGSIDVLLAWINSAPNRRRQ